MGFQNAGRTAPDSPGNGPLDAHSWAACCNLPNTAPGSAPQAFDSSVKHFCAVAANLKDLAVAVEERRRTC
jgi:hypothetical protein